MNLKHLLSPLAPKRVLDMGNNPIGVPLNLSITNTALTQDMFLYADRLQDYIDGHIAANKAHYAYGGYMERRAIYDRSDNFDGSERRNIHVGMDLWVAAGTPVLAVLAGTVHSFQDNNGFGNYGPTMILQHEIQGETFWTLYGHVSRESLQGLEVGQTFGESQPIATLGTAAVNGDYPPHLHFQIISDIGDYKGDYPGVIAASDIEKYKTLTPNPNLLLSL